MPQIFGHRDKIEVFKKLVRENNLSHAYLFYGYPQIGKFSFAKRFAFFMEFGEFEESDKPLIDARFFLPEEGVIGVPAVRELKKFLSARPIKSSRRLAIINEADALTREAQSALLKIVEEPPPSALIMFIAHDPQVLFAPLRSRLTSVYFRSFREDSIGDFIVEKYKFSKAKAGEIARRSFGRIGRAVNLAEKSEAAVGDELQQYLEDSIIRLYLAGSAKNSGVLSELLRRETAVKRFNLNAGLQRKAVEQILGL